MSKYGVTTALRPHTTLRRLLVHPKDKEELAEQGELVDQIPCKNCGASILEISRKAVDNTNNENSPRAGKKPNF